MTDLSTDPAILKLIAYAKKKKTITYEEVNDFLPEEIVSSDRIEEVIAILEKNQIKLEEEDLSLEVEEEKPAPGKQKLVYDDKESAVDDPIRLYLREIGKESLLTAEQEVYLSKKMEEGENIIKKVIKTSGLFVPELYRLGQAIVSRVDPRELNLSKKEISEYLAERRRVTAFYREPLRPHYASIKLFIEAKRRLEPESGSILGEQSLAQRKEELLKRLADIDLHQEEITTISEKFLQAANRVRKVQKEKQPGGQRPEAAARPGAQPGPALRAGPHRAGAGLAG
jgi:RNA polymerase primary sigma factor